ncbi:MAG: EamA family transporter [Aquificales bacterium]|nr:EamA family transporter [Aquificales bacterium]
MSPIILLILATILWGIWGIVNKLALEQAHPYSVQWLYSIPYMLVIPIFFWLGTRTQSGNDLNGAAVFWTLLSSIVSIFAVLMMLFAMRSQPASLAVAVTSAYPLVTLSIAVLLKMETFSVQKVFGILLIIVGLVVLLWQK